VKHSNLLRGAAVSLHDGLNIAGMKIPFLNQLQEVFSVKDEQLMWRIQVQEDEEAFAELVRRWRGPIWNLCTRMIGDIHRAEDLVQETFTRVYNKRADFDTRQKFSTWLWRIALNLCYDELRRRNRRPAEQTSNTDEEQQLEQLPAFERSPSIVMEESERASEVWRALSSLPESLRSVLVLRHYQDLKFREIAEILNIPEGTVKSRMFEGLQRMGTLLNHPENRSTGKKETLVL
jgi:RNA polymerase sigma-70 factor (ECF subfamily)